MKLYTYQTHSNKIINNSKSQKQQNKETKQRKRKETDKHVKTKQTNGQKKINRHVNKK